MGAHNDTSNDYKLFSDGSQLGVDPGAGGTLNLQGRDRRIFSIASGTRVLPNNIPIGVSVRVLATGTVTITDAAATTVATLTSGDIGTFTAKSSTTWNSSVSATGGTSAAGIVVADAQSLLNATNVETALEELITLAGPNSRGASTTISTAGAGTLTAAGMTNGVILRSGPTGDYTDTTDTAANIIAALGSTTYAGQSWFLFIRNTVAFTQTISAGAGVVQTGLFNVSPNSVGTFLMVSNGVNAVTMTGLGSLKQANLPNAKFTTNSTGTQTLAAGQITGAGYVVWQNTHDTTGAILTRTATEMFADTPNAHTGFSWMLLVVNEGDVNPITITGGTGVTITGTATVVNKTTRLFHCIFPSSSTMTMTSVSKGTIE